MLRFPAYCSFRSAGVNETHTPAERESRNIQRFGSESSPLHSVQARQEGRERAASPKHSKDTRPALPCVNTETQISHLSRTRKLHPLTPNPHKLNTTATSDNYRIPLGCAKLPLLTLPRLRPPVFTVTCVRAVTGHYSYGNSDRSNIGGYSLCGRCRGDGKSLCR